MTGLSGHGKEEIVMCILKNANLMIVGMVVLFVAGVLTIPGYAKLDPKNAVGIWLFDEGNGDVAKDSSGNGNDGTLKGPKWVDGKFGKALEFNGASDYVNTGNDPITDISGTKILSISAWVKRATKTSKVLVAIRRSPGGYILGVGVLGAATNQIKMTKFAIVDIYLGDFPQDTNWHHLVGVWHEKGQIAYIDGVVNANSADTANFSSASTGSLLIGGDTGDQGYTAGAIDDVGIFNVALTEGDVKDIMKQGLGRAIGITPVSPKGRLTTVWGEIKAK
jgi:hypothetical protein